MLFPEEHASMLKAWIVKRLESVSHADADVLADYVLALLQDEGDVGDLRKLCQAEISDFLKGDTAAVFIDDLFRAITYQSYLPGRKSPPDASRPNPQKPNMYDPSQPLEGFTPILPPPEAVASIVKASRKRTYQDRAEASSEQYPPQYSRRHHKQARRGNFARGWPDTLAPHLSTGLPYGPVPFSGLIPPLPPLPQPPVPVSVNAALNGFPFDANNSRDAFLQIQALGASIPPIPGYSPHGPQASSPRRTRRRGRCRDFESKGYCARGAACMFEHVDPSFTHQLPPHMSVIPPTPISHDAPRSMIPAHAQFGSHASHVQENGGQSGGSGHNPGAKRRKAPFSADGPVHDRNITTLVVENIPDEHCNEKDVIEFFCQFGPISEVSLRPDQRLAVVKFVQWGSANAAYRSPKVMFDNRFVKVFWYTASEDDSSQQDAVVKVADGVTNGHSAAATNAAVTVPEFDMTDFLQKQEQAQRLFVEKKKKRDEIDALRQDIEARQQALMTRHFEATRQLQARLSATRETNDSDANLQHDRSTERDTVTSEALRAQLAALESEAKLLGLNPDAAEDDAVSPESRGGYGRGRASYRARGYRGYRSGFRGGHAGIRKDVHTAYRAYSLDNRPRTIAVKGVDFTIPEKDELLRQYLLGVGEFEDIQSAPDTTHISFVDRKTAEAFMHSLANSTIPGIDSKLELSWIASMARPPVSTPSAELPLEGSLNSQPVKNLDQAEDTAMSGVVGGGVASPRSPGRGKSGDKPREDQQEENMDYEVADETDWTPK